MAIRFRKKSRKQSRKMRGGSAWQHTVGTYGGVGQQHAVVGNVIAQQDATAPAVEPPVKGGGLTELAVPAVLLLANQSMKRRRSNKNFRRKSVKRGRSRRFRK